MQTTLKKTLKDSVVLVIDSQLSKKKVIVPKLREPVVHLSKFNRLEFSQNQIACHTKKNKVFWIKNLKDGFELYKKMVNTFEQGETLFEVSSEDMVDLNSQVYKLSEALCKLDKGLVHEQELIERVSSLRLDSQQVRNLFEEKGLPNNVDPTVLAFGFAKHLGKPRNCSWNAFNFWKNCIKKSYPLVQFSY